MGRKKVAGVSQLSSKKAAQKASKYDQLVALNDRLLAASALSPAVKELESSCKLISELVEQIRCLQQPEDSSDHVPKSRETKLERFVKWCNECGIQSDKVELSLFEGLGVGLKATQKIQHHEMFLCIPRSLMMTVDLQTTNIAQLLKTDPIASRMPNIALALYLLAEKFNRSSSWKPYIDVLPESYDTPLYFTADEISLLRGSCTYEQSVRMQRNIARQYSYFWSLFTNQSDKYPAMAKHFTYDSYRWAVSTVMTRQNIVPRTKDQSDSDNQPGGVLALIPFWDMCNHKQGEMLTDYDEDLNECHCYANLLCEPGDQVYICYSTRPNSDFLVHNGFVYPDNPNDNVQLKLGLSKTDVFINTRRQLLEKHAISGGDVHVFYLSKSSADSPVPDDLLTFLRVFNSTEDELNSVVERESQDGSHDKFEPISEENDRKCWSFLKIRCSLLIKTYNGNFSDNELLESLNSVHVKMARNQVDAEISILNDIIDLCDKKLKS